ncbi:MAG: carbon storage regulator CsrA [Actinobacteria bacterium]|nr:carbon storage regulator CsrA [Actinomycetota bacterium]
MLVLSRRVGESIVIGSDVVVTVLEVRGDIIRIGVDAPREVTVHRSEVYEQIEAANRAAAAPDAAAVSALTAALSQRPGASSS